MMFLVVFLAGLWSAPLGYASGGGGLSRRRDGVALCGSSCGLLCVLWAAIAWLHAASMVPVGAREDGDDVAGC